MMKLMIVLKLPGKRPGMYNLAKKAHFIGLVAKISTAGCK